ncbi:hypothetical protein RRF57_011639 [Xylaria bambusicola]|uniref:Uncharacterized protein n=1 Tax=Xylaria bambusicola TaxID=326684 RepID=A0AAN7V0V6_9PEZI
MACNIVCVEMGFFTQIQLIVRPKRKYWRGLEGKGDSTLCFTSVLGKAYEKKVSLFVSEKFRGFRPVRYPPL